MKKQKIFNDPVYGFITIPDGILMELVDHPYFQRLTRIRQLGLTYLIYPGALHTRFHHGLGALHLTMQAIETLRNKGIEINEEEAEAVCIAILLHDIGHGPFSHALENVFIPGINHEQITGLLMEKLNKEFEGRLAMTIEIYNNTYHKNFLHRLVSSQLDMDRLDYLIRDSFYTGVAEGVVSYDRIIKMLFVHKSNLVVEAKGIYSIEKFLIARRLMYWQVYLHKTVLAAEQLLLKIINRAKFLCSNGHKLFASPAFAFFLENYITENEVLITNSQALQMFTLLDDIDVFSSIKVWTESDDKVLSELCRMLINRKLYKIQIQNEPFEKTYIRLIEERTKKMLGLDDQEAEYFAFAGSIANNAYSLSEEKINIIYKDGRVSDITQASDLPNISLMTSTVKKYFFCGIKETLF